MTSEKLKNYIEGEGCKCCARSSSECGCHERNESLEELKPLRQRTPETDDFELNLDDYRHPWKAIEFARKLERERDEARTDLEFRRGLYKVQEQYLERMKQERDEAREEIKEWKTLCLWGGTPEHIHGFIRGQHSRIQHLERERDEAREALMRIEDLFLDGTDIYADRENMGLIARAALEETK